MTAVAPPLTSFHPSRWTSNGNDFGSMNSDEVSRMFAPGLRKTAQRQNSSSSIASTTSSTSTISASSTQASGGAVHVPADGGSWVAKKRPTRGLWPPGKAEPATGLSTARPQTISSVTSGPTASSAISALHAPLLPSQQMANGTVQGNGALRERVSGLSPAVLQLLPMNSTFERKIITIPYTPDVLRIGRQTNQKTVPTPHNGYFDSKVLSRQHAEVYAEPSGRIFIRDVKSSNGTFVNGMRLSQENKESEPRELREQDVLELGIDIVSEDQKTVVHHKVAAKVEHAGIFQQGNDNLNFGDLDPSAGPAPLVGPQQLRRTGSQGSINGRVLGNPAAQQSAMGLAALPQPQHMRNWLNPVTTEQIYKKLQNETKIAAQQQIELRYARELIEKLLGGSRLEPSAKEARTGSERERVSPTKSKLDLKAHFLEPPAPPPQAPLPEKPDVARALADPLIQPLLRRTDTAKPSSASSSPTRTDHSSDILRLCEELKLAKGELNHQNERMRNLENQLAQERTARENAEERAQRLERVDRRDSPTNNGHPSAQSSPSAVTSNVQPPDLQSQMDQLRSTMDEMSLQMEAYRQRAKTAELDRDEARQSLAELIEQKRKENAEGPNEGQRSPSSKSPKTASKRMPNLNGKAPAGSNGHISTLSPIGSPTSESLLQRAGLEEGQPITEEQARIITQFLAQEVLGPQHKVEPGDMDNALLYYGLPYGSFAAVVLLGYIAMTWVNGWPKIER